MQRNEDKRSKMSAKWDSCKPDCVFDSTMAYYFSRWRGEEVVTINFGLVPNFPPFEYFILFKQCSLLFKFMGLRGHLQAVFKTMEYSPFFSPTPSLMSWFSRRRQRWLQRRRRRLYHQCRTLSPSHSFARSFRVLLIPRPERKPRCPHNLMHAEYFARRFPAGIQLLLSVCITAFLRLMSVIIKAISNRYFSGTAAHAKRS